MDINLLTLSLGNSRLAAGVFSGGELTHVVRVPVGNQAILGQTIAAAWKLIAQLARPAIAVASVNGPAEKMLGEIVLGETGQKPQWVGRELDLPINVLTEEPAKTGVDRVVNIAAAFEQLERACVVVDAGTAVTLDFCNDNGDFLGGAILPGTRMMLAALHEKTAGLPAVEFQVPQGTVGASTAAAMCQGVYHSIRGMVREIVENYATDLGRWPEVIATGGDAAMLFGGWEVIHAVSPDLTLYGVALAFTEHHIRNDT
jgi:type III pantothenate kinase